MQPRTSHHTLCMGRITLVSSFRLLPFPGPIVSSSKHALTTHTQMIQPKTGLSGCCAWGVQDTSPASAPGPSPVPSSAEATMLQPPAVDSLHHAAQDRPLQEHSPRTAGDPSAGLPMHVAAQTARTRCRCCWRASRPCWLRKLRAPPHPAASEVLGRQATYRQVMAAATTHQLLGRRMARTAVAAARPARDMGAAWLTQVVEPQQ